MRKKSMKKKVSLWFLLLLWSSYVVVCLLLFTTPHSPMRDIFKLTLLLCIFSSSTQTRCKPLQGPDKPCQDQQLEPCQGTCSGPFQASRRRDLVQNPVKSFPKVWPESTVTLLLTPRRSKYQLGLLCVQFTCPSHE
ncbi:hypothetical protein ILYODFUR_025832 [Ilyodon furcidens]|uniref:Secreted protein n=1 Tax=Ilyodon furcidens TaxID=33524 RepID=A0ABV0UVA9_9TELE